MKKFFAILSIVCLTSCNNSSENTTRTDSMTTGSDSGTAAPVATDSVTVNSDSASSKMNTTTTTDTAKN